MDRLSQIGRPIPPLGLRKIVAETRRVDADDLMALAVALGVSPITLVIPDTARADTEVAVTGLAAPFDVESLWEWLTARGPLRYGNEFEFFSRAWPRWLQAQQRYWLEGIDALHAGMREKTRQLRGLSEDAEASHGDD